MDASLLSNIFSYDSPKLVNQHDEHVLLRQSLFVKVKRLSRNGKETLELPNHLEQNQSTL